jgi:hypothetical protein
MNKNEFLSNLAGALAPVVFSLILWYFGFPFPACAVVSVGYWIWWFFIATNDNDPYEGI